MVPCAEKDFHDGGRVLVLRTEAAANVAVVQFISEKRIEKPLADDEGRVDVGVIRVPAGSAQKGLLRRAVAFTDVPAFRALPARVGGGREVREKALFDA